MAFKNNLIIGILSFSLLGGCAELSLEQALQTGLEVSQALSQNSEQSYSQAIKETLELSSTRAAQSLSEPGGYSGNPAYKIAMPEQLDAITSTLRTFGLNKQVDEIEQLMNQGAEAAATEAKAVFIDAVKQMSISDALGIIQGSDTAATEYFESKTENILRQRYQPIIESHLSKVGFYQEYQGFLTTYNKLPIANKPELDLQQHVLRESLAGLFSQVAKEEALIRQDPIGKGSAFLGSVFGKK
jgi:hypothetical protein